MAKESRNGNFMVISYMDRISHNLKKLARRFGVNAVFSAPNKLRIFCAYTRKRKWVYGCQKRHGREFTNYMVDVAHCIELSFRSRNIGKTGQRSNESMRDH